MGKVISVVNQKGGVGKTTTAVNLSACLAIAEKMVLLIDLDPQGNTSSGIGIDRKVIGVSIYNILIGETDIKDGIYKTEIGSLFLIPSTMDLIGAEIELVGMEGREARLRRALEQIRDEYEFIIIDTPPSLGLLTINSLTAADSVLIPLQCEYYALEGLSHLLRTIKLVKKSLNPSLTTEGILLTMHDGRTLISNQIFEEVKRYFSNYLFKTIIPRSVRLSEAPGHGKPIIFYDIKSKGATAYLDLAREVIANAEKGLRSGVGSTYS
ncbi:MAG: ParA family protein [Nitrospinae bacterium]|nr:ParA family protein [Nitrospinota bacterium]